MRLLVAIGAAAAAAAVAYATYRTARRKSGLTVQVLPDKYKLGAAAARHVADKIAATIKAKGHARVIFATGASQFEFIEQVLMLPVQWDKVTAFHLDEYVGLPETHGASFRKYLKERLFGK